MLFNMILCDRVPYNFWGLELILWGFKYPIRSVRAGQWFKKLFTLTCLAYLFDLPYS
jgi:hypothetical protein